MKHMTQKELNRKDSKFSKLKCGNLSDVQPLENNRSAICKSRK